MGVPPPMHTGRMPVPRVPARVLQEPLVHTIDIRMEIEKLFCMVKMASQQDAAADTDPHGVT